MNVALGADHAGVELKDALKTLLAGIGVSHVDFGTSSREPVDYPDYAGEVARGVADGTFDRGILVCGSGIGMAIAANKVPGIRAAVASDVTSAGLCREHNDANVLALGARFLSVEQAASIVRTFLAAEFGGDRHRRRLEKIRHLEAGLRPPQTVAPASSEESQPS